MSTAEASAGRLLAQYGDDAGVIAVMRAAEAAAAGDEAALEHWDAVIALLEQGAFGPRH